MPLFKIVHLVDAPNKADAEAYTHLVAQAYINQGYHNHFVRIKVSKHRGQRRPWVITYKGNILHQFKSRAAAKRCLQQTRNDRFAHDPKDYQIEPLIQNNGHA